MRRGLFNYRRATALEGHIKRKSGGHLPVHDCGLREVSACSRLLRPVTRRLIACSNGLGREGQRSARRPVYSAG